MGINFADLNPIAQQNVIEPIAKGHAIAAQAFRDSLASTQAAIKEEGDAMRIVSEEMLKSGKVDFMGSDITNFKNRYDTEKRKLVDKLKNFDSVQSFLNNGGYEHIADFKNSIDNSEEYKKGLMNKIEFGVVQHLLSNGVHPDDLKFDETGGVNKWLNGESDHIGFQGTYNRETINPQKYVLDRSADKTETYDTESVRKLLEAEGYNPKKIQAAIDAHAQNAIFYKSFQDPNKVNKELDLRLKSLQISNEAAYKKQLLDQKTAYENGLLDLKKKAQMFQNAAIETNFDSFTQGRESIPISEFQKPPQFFTTHIVNKSTKQKITGAEAETALSTNEAEKTDFLKPGTYSVITPGTSVLPKSPSHKKLMNAQKQGEPVWNVKFDAWVIPVLDDSGNETWVLQATDTRKNNIAKRNLLLNYNPDRKDWQEYDDALTPSPTAPSGNNGNDNANRTHRDLK